MEVNFNPKAPDIYQVTKAPSNRYDAISNAIGLGVTGLMVFGFLGLCYYYIYKTSEKK